MNPTDFPEANLRLLAPPSMPECLPLSVHRYPATERVGHVAVVKVDNALARGLGRADTPRPDFETVHEPGGYISRWEPTPGERAAIAAGGPVWVYVVGDGSPPPIAVSGVSPFETPLDRAKRTMTASGWAEAFDAYEKATGRQAVEDWSSWEAWALQHSELFPKVPESGGDPVKDLRPRS